MKRPAETDLQAEARAWVSRLTSGEATTVDLATFHRWRDSSAGHRRAFAEAKMLWGVLRPAAELSVARADAQRTAALHSRSESRIGRRAFIGGAMAASLAGAGWLTVRPPLELWPSLDEVRSDYRTAKGEVRQIKVADVSVEMNTQTSIALLPDSEGGDVIELVSGEASITPGAHATRSFGVLAGGGRATGRNGSFNVRHTGASGCVSCVSGEVAVMHHGAEVMLRPQQQVSYDSRGLRPVVDTDMAVVTAWQQGLLIFRSDPLSRVIEEVNRYRAGRIVLMNDELGRRPVFANFRIDRMDDVVPRLQAVFGMRVRSLPGDIVLMS